jgi:hypothetical protein
LPWAKLELAIQMLKKSCGQKADDLGHFWAYKISFFPLKKFVYGHLLVGSVEP